MILLVLGGSVVLADGQSLQLTNPLSCTDFTCAVNKVIGFIQLIGSPIAVLMVLVGAFQMMTAAGNPEKFSQGRKTILYAAIGLFVLIIAGGITSIIQSLFS